METKPQRIFVEMPDKKLLNVEYYCIDSVTTKEKESFTQLFIQLDDCICKMKIEKSILNKDHEIERIVHNKVISERGHLC
jgi:hypothetical protein